MSQLPAAPATSTAPQRQRIVLLARRQGMTVDDARAMAGCRLHDLSAREASDLIGRLGGGPLPTTPGGTRPRRRSPADGTVGIITPDQVEQLERLGFEYFGSRRVFGDWLYKNFKVESVRDLATRRRAGQILYVLKGMLKRKRAPRRGCIGRPG